MKIINSKKLIYKYKIKNIRKLKNINDKYIFIFDLYVINGRKESLMKRNLIRKTFDDITIVKFIDRMEGEFYLILSNNIREDTILR